MSEIKLSAQEVARFLNGNARSRRAFMAAFGATAAAFTVSACSKGGAKSGETAKIVIPNSEKQPLKFYNWDTYIGETTLDDFKAASDVPVEMTLFANNDELFAKFRAGNPGYDVIMPSNEYVTRMAQAGLLEPLDHSKIPNLKNLAPQFFDPEYDRGSKYSATYTWLVVGVGYRKSAMKNGVAPDSWKTIFDSDEYKGRISLPGESMDLFRLTFKYLGHSVNDYTPELIKQAEEILIKQKANIKNFHDDNGQDLLLSKEVDLVVELNGDIAQVRNEDDDIDFIVPKEGSLLNTDCMCIPKGAPSPNNAHAFINYILDGKVGAEITKTILYPTPNDAAKALMDDGYKTNTIIFPPADQMKNCEYGKYLGDKYAQDIEAAMNRVRAS
ncbi:ABC transporter substrate-binding protein [Pseudaquidulcibacter saccharophilus]|uniref:ABC transporter substrate-binding protein n=1 Tax=Pseudaquidulcibacter saccharophilus TaxID=2831900 RepID=UPI001EFF5C53|nr:spermidine/putrescine ABC transporter substrate-binding protein [Pseudaquidulcibacter saccharophilus]